MEEDDAWQPDEFLAEFDSDSFDVETHATGILRQGNINEEVSSSRLFAAGLTYLELCCRC